MAQYHECADLMWAEPADYSVGNPERRHFGVAYGTCDNMLHFWKRNEAAGMYVCPLAHIHLPASASPVPAGVCSA